MIAQSKKIKAGFLLIVLSALSTTVASNITINSGKKLEFGQGLIRLSACSQYVNINFSSTAPDGQGNQYLNLIKIQDLNALQCSGTTFTIQIYNSSKVLQNIYTDSSTHNGVNFIKLSISSSPANQATAASLINASGVNIGNGDTNESLSYDSASGSYLVSILNPTLNESNVGSFTVQSASN
jgi:hypothetical protein